MPNKRDDNPVSRGFGAGYGIVAAGFQLAFSILFFLGMGVWADRKLETKPWLTLIGLAIGMGAGFYAFYLRVQAASKAGREQPDGDKRH